VWTPAGYAHCQVIDPETMVVEAVVSGPQHGQVWNPAEFRFSLHGFGRRVEITGHCSLPSDGCLV